MIFSRADVPCIRASIPGYHIMVSGRVAEVGGPRDRRSLLAMGLILQQGATTYAILLQNLFCRDLLAFWCTIFSHPLLSFVVLLLLLFKIMIIHDCEIIIWKYETPPSVYKFQQPFRAWLSTPPQGFQCQRRVVKTCTELSTLSTLPHFKTSAGLSTHCVILLPKSANTTSLSQKYANTAFLSRTF